MGEGSAKLATLTMIVALAGCLSPELAGNEPAFEPLHMEGDFWVESGPTADAAVETIPFPVNATGKRTRVEVSITSTYGGIALTGSTAQVTIRLLDANGDEIGTGSREPLGSQNLHVEAEDLPVGEAKLLVEVRGGSDGSANGDHIAWTIDVS